MTRPRIAVLAATALLLALAAFPADAVEAQGLRLDPADAAVLGAGSVLRPAIPPGAAASYPLRLRNTREVAVEALVYGADADGTDVASGAANTGVGTWINTDVPRVELAAEATTVIEVTITRPDDDQDGGRGAVVVQLSDSSREDLGLEVLQRAALPIEIAADGSGDGTPTEITGTASSGGLVPGDLAVELVVTNPSSVPAAPDTVLIVGRPIGEDARIPVEVEELAAGATVTTTTVVEVPWWGLVGPLHVEAATVGLTSSSAPVRAVVIPPWAALLLVVLATTATLRARRQTEPFELGRVPGFEASDADEPDADEPDADVGPEGAPTGTEHNEPEAR